MAYTVKQLAELSGVSVRTLHWYDKIGLLKPDCIGANGYRYYKESQLLILQQILFFRELGFALKDIKKLVVCADFDTLETLYAHRMVLEKEIERKTKLLITIDRTILYVKGAQAMSNNELFYGFNKEKQQELFVEIKKRIVEWTKDDWNNLIKRSDAVFRDVACAINQGLEPHSTQVQEIIHRYYYIIERFYSVSKEIYKNLAYICAQHSDIKKRLDTYYHPKMAEFISEAMEWYAQKRLN